MEKYIEENRGLFESNEFKIKLNKAINDFSVLHEDLSQTKNAEWKCIETSWDFIKFLNDENVIQPEMIEQGLVRVEHISVNAVPHTVVRIGNQLVDWTYRQFEPESQFPHISLVR